MMLMKFAPSLPALCGALLLAGCGPLVQVGGNTPPPTSLLTLTATVPASIPADSALVDLEKAVTVQRPGAPGALRTLRIPVMVSDIDVQYITGAQWSEQPTWLFRRLVEETLVQSGIPVINPRTAGTTSGRVLSGQLAAFGVDIRSGSPVARVRYDVTLQTPEGLRQQHFERTEPMTAVNGAQAGNALNRAANAVAADVAQWLRG